MSREVCGICWCPYDDITGECACPPPNVQKSTLREAAQQALEALKSSTPKPRNEDDDYAEKGWKEHTDAITALKAALAESNTCTWCQDGDSDSTMYQTSCRKYSDLTDGTPEDNKMQWCCYCGKKLVQLLTEDDDE